MFNHGIISDGSYIYIDNNPKRQEEVREKKKRKCYSDLYLELQIEKKD
jgi:hypothetical protein